LLEKKGRDISRRNVCEKIDEWQMCVGAGAGYVTHPQGGGGWGQGRKRKREGMNDDTKIEKQTNKSCPDERRRVQIRRFLKYSRIYKSVTIGTFGINNAFKNQEKNRTAGFQAKF
jgi:hypothetical protein